MSAKRILIVDDNSLSRKLLTDMLDAEGYEVSDVASGAEALAAIADRHPDLVLLDIMMPEMDGFEVVRRLKADKATRATRVVMVTALDDEGSRARLAAAGVDVMLTKPINRWELRSLLARTFSASREKTQ
jgi:CheY-like chemotaxis protein